MTGTEIANNVAENTADGSGLSRGGALFSSGAAEIELIDVTVSGNQALSESNSAYGGALYTATNTNLILTDCTITENTARASGSGYAQGVGIYFINL